MKADEIFILLLVVVCAVAVAALALHSRRLEKAPAAQGSQTEDEIVGAQQARMNEEIAEPRTRRNKRRR